MPPHVAAGWHGSDAGFVCDADRSLNGPPRQLVRRRTCLVALAALSAAPAAFAVAAAVDGPRFAVALGSGSMHGVAHIGVLRGCEKLGLKPDLIVGTSSGAAIGALWAAGLDSGAIAKLARGVDFGEVSSLSLRPWRGLARNAALAELIDRAVGGRRIEQLPTRFMAVATDLATGAPIVLAEGPTGEAVAASCAIPVLYVPVRVGGRELVDGSLSAPVPVDAARQQGAAFVLGVDVAYRPSDEPARHLLEAAFQTLHIFVNALAAEQTRRADLVLRLSLHHLFDEAGLFDALIDAGEAALLAQAETLRPWVSR